MERITGRQQITGLLFAGPYIVGILVFLALPLTLAAYYSFCNYTLLQSPVWVGLENYARLLHDHVFWISLKNTLFYAACSVPLTLAASVLLAILLNFPLKSQAIYRTIVFLPSLVPAVATALMWQWLYNDRLGLVNHLLAPPLSLFGKIMANIEGVLGATPQHIAAWRNIAPPAWLNDPHWAMAAVIFLSVWGIGQTVVIFLAGLQDIPRTLYEAAEIDGVSPLGRFLHVTLPMLSPVIFFNLIMGIIGTWQFFDVPYVMTGGGPKRSTTFYTMYLYQAAFTQLRIGAASAMAWIQFLIILLLTGIAFATARKWVHYT